MSNKFCLNDKYKKNKGFTLLELIAVMAIITILATAILPKVTGYINEAKKTKVLDQCRKVVMAVESYNLTHSSNYEKNKNISNIKDDKSVNKYLEDVEFNNLELNTTIQNCYDVLNGKEFKLKTGSEMLDLSTIN
ncbi:MULTISPECIES: type II secretion system protein [Clostridium]|uniref:type II secretion system protein n=1 Tax=Clostridium TaxID=1485 RepID=UPI0002DEEC48|nr:MULTISPECIES: type II secretion system protein [Clostridium]MBN1037433.1 type II secretion system protein [Clostridium botulinum]MBN1044095.1 type II secretion system protein [Clostridium botulinum]MBN1050784.1 type II secretion system protein [Clostridium botulinum]MBN1054080.1 type II secretion system protein [Clostridium botulinum]NFN95095.1 type II secretion system protein [Clostridium botulinum]